MRRRVLRCVLCSGAAVMLLAMSACARSAPAARGTTASGGTPVYDAWTTPPDPGSTYVARPATAAALQPAPRAVGPAPTATGYASQGYASPGVAAYPGSPPPPPPPPGGGSPEVGAPVSVAPVAVAPTPTPAGTGGWVVPARTYTCGLPCADGISQWHVRGVVGIATFSGTDSAENCNYYGLDVGRTFCGCWGLDFYYRYNSGRFTREPIPGRTFKDGGEYQHFGAKLTYERGFGRNSRFYGWGGIGAGYFTTSKYIANDDGAEIFGELGVAYVLSRNWRLRAGVNVHGMDTKVTRRLPANDGQKRQLWIIAPVVEIEYSF